MNSRVKKEVIALASLEGRDGLGGGGGLGVGGCLCPP
jgi:hypothetical protein